MLFTLVVSIIFLFLALSVGQWITDLLAGSFPSGATPVLQNFLAGFAFISTYLNTWSLFLPVNYYALIPVFLSSLFLAKRLSRTLQKIKRLSRLILTLRFAVIALPILLVILAYALLPPQHGDSPGYHFLTIRWNETYKAVHGLANLHGRLGFNSSFFVTSAAFSFSPVAGQALYVLNIVFVVAYYLWLLEKMNSYRNNLWSLVFLFVALLMFRQFLDSISSPTPDILSTIIISYVFITITENILINNKLGKQQTLLLLLLTCFAFTVKLNTFPLAFIGLFLFIQTGMHKSTKHILLLMAAGSIILVPWILRTYLLTGYLIFPVSVTGFLHPDWQVPYSILHFEKLLINNGPKMISEKWEAVDKLSFVQWLPLWLKANVTNGLTFSLLVLTAAVISLLVSIVIINPKKQPALFWLAIINTVSIVFWIYNSPDYRFGYPYLLNAIILLSLLLARKRSITFPLQPFIALVIFLCTYYCKHALTILSPYTVSSLLLKPLPGVQYNVKTPAATFPFMMLNEKVKLYVEDEKHPCNMAGLPCLVPYEDNFPIFNIELRGNNVDQGFKITEK